MSVDLDIPIDLDTNAFGLDGEVLIMANTLDNDDEIFNDIAVLLGAATGRPVWVHEVPSGVGRPDLPYYLLSPSGSGSWDRGILSREHSCAWYGMQVTAVGRGQDKDGQIDYLALLGVLRAVFDTVTLSGLAWACSMVDSEGPPTPIESTGGLTSAAERYQLYIEAV